jgi:hypothetical protein
MDRKRALQAAQALRGLEDANVVDGAFDVDILAVVCRRVLGGCGGEEGQSSERGESESRVDPGHDEEERERGRDE